MAARVAVDLDLFKLIAESSKPMTSAQLAQFSGGEELLIRLCSQRAMTIPFCLADLMQFVFSESLVELDSCMRLARIPGSRRPRLKPWLTRPLPQVIILCTSLQVLWRSPRRIDMALKAYRWDFVINAAIKAPQFLREVGHRSPSEPTDGLVQYAHHTKLNAFNLLFSQPNLLRNFNQFMGNTMGARHYWVDWYPVEERLLNGSRPDGAALLVDVGGGKGHDLQAFYTKYPRQTGLVLQDQPHALDKITAESLDPSVKRMVHDFFKEQPIKGSLQTCTTVLTRGSANEHTGARAYFLHHILHDWSDKYCLEILKHLRAAMEPRYSILLIHDLILPNKGATAYQAIFDMTMMTFNSGMERSQTQWEQLLDQAGFEVVKFWIDDEDADGIVEALPKHSEH